MAFNNMIFYSVPKSFIMNIVNTVTMVGTIKELFYKDNYESLKWEKNINEYINSHDENPQVVDIYLSYYIDDDIANAFEAYLNKYVQKFSDNMLHLEKCLAVKEND